MDKFYIYSDIHVQLHLWQSRDILLIISELQVRLCREKKSGNIYAMKKLKKSEMLMRGQVRSLDRKLTSSSSGSTVTIE